MDYTENNEARVIHSSNDFLWCYIHSFMCYLWE